MDDQPQDPTAPPPPPPPVPPPAADQSLAPPPPDPAPAPSRGRRTAVVLIAALVVVLGAGAAAAFFAMKGSSEQLVGVVPADVDVFATVYLDPSAGQKANLLALASRFPDLGEGASLEERVNDLLDEAFADADLTHEDVRPWLGSQFGISVDVGDDGTAHYAIMISTTDPEASRTAIEKIADQPFTTSDHDGVQISSVTGNEGGSYAIVEDVVVFASDETTVKRSIDAAHGTSENLEGSQVYLDTLAGLPEGKLGVAYVNVQGLVEQFGSDTAASAALGAGGLADLDSIESIGMSLSAETDGIALDLTTNYDPTKLTPEQREVLSAPDHQNATLALVPSDAFAVIAAEHVDTSLQSTLDAIEEQTPDATAAIDQAGIRDLLAAMTGDIALEVGPGTDGPASGALLVGTDDEAGMQTFLDGLGTLATQALAQQGSSGVPDDLLAQMGACGGTPNQIARCQQQLLDSYAEVGTAQVEPLVTEEYEGVTITWFEEPSLRSVGVAPAYAVVDGAGVIASSPEEIEQLIDSQASGDDIASSPVFTSATANVPIVESVFFLDVQAIAGAVRQNLPSDAQATYDQDVAPNLAPITAFVVGGESDQEHQTIRMFLQIP